MPRENEIYVNLPVKNLDRSMAFLTGLGFAFEPKFTSDSAACMTFDQNIFVMLLVESFRKTFTR